MQWNSEFLTRRPGIRPHLIMVSPEAFMLSVFGVGGDNSDQNHLNCNGFTDSAHCKGPDFPLCGSPHT